MSWLDQETTRADPFEEFGLEDGDGDLALDDEGDLTSNLQGRSGVQQRPDWEEQLEGVSHDPGLGLLLDLAKKGEYDPWDVDVVSVCDRYLAALDENLDAFDLGNAGKVMFYAAALHHLKAQAVAQQEAERQALEAAVDDMFALDDPLDMDGMLGGRLGLRPDDMPLLYPDFMRDPGGPRGGTLSPRNRQPRSRGLTLIDLIAALRDYDDRLAQEEALALAEERFEDVAIEECVGSSHQDDLEQDIVDVRQFLWERLADEPKTCELQDTCTPERSRAASFLALLFLAHDEEVELNQTDFYGHLHIKPGVYFGEVRAGVIRDDDDRIEYPAEDDLDDEDGARDAEDGFEGAEDGFEDAEDGFEDAEDGFEDAEEAADDEPEEASAKDEQGDGPKGDVDEPAEDEDA